MQPKSAFKLRPNFQAEKKLPSIHDTDIKIRNVYYLS